ncbi:MAG: hypothetical protein HOJ02_01440 [Rhodospirillaceae bacterium]|nr:hypothetical protein [Rhodospirillaceae bacterium]MBT5658795.1 hypothetical protein [Rhodospirillaceae bacterium]
MFKRVKDFLAKDKRILAGFILAPLMPFFICVIWIFFEDYDIGQAYIFFMGLNSIWASYISYIPLFYFFSKLYSLNILTILGLSFLMGIFIFTISAYILFSKIPEPVALGNFGLTGAGIGLAFWLIAIWRNPRLSPQAGN